MALQTTLEIMVQQGGRWIIHARYPVTKKEAAVEEAKSLEKTPGIGAVKVIKDVYDQARGTSAEYIIYKTAGVKSDSDDRRSPAKPPPAQQRASDFGEPEFEETRRGRAPRPAPAAKPKARERTSLGGILLRLMAVLAVGLIGGAAATAGLFYSITGPTFLGISLVGDSGANFYLGVFIVSFLAVAGFMSSILLGGKGIAVPAHKTEMPTFKPKPPPPKKPMARPAPSEVALPGEEAAPTPDELAQQLREAAAEILKDSEAKEEQVSPMAEAEAAPAQSTPAEVPAVAASATGAPLDPHAEKQKTYMLRFLGRALEQVAVTHKKLDSYTKFGLNLFLAGACEILSQKSDLDAATRARILSDGVQALGFKPDHALGFAGNYESYLLQDARYMQMVQAGRNAMNTYFSDEDEGLKHLAAAIGDWSKPKPKEEQSQVITVMFTDMVGSTALTQTRGQQVAQQVVRAHNRIVRQALTRFYGREIKHTGDGIMASFAQASSAVDAAIQIQKDVAAHCRDYPDLPLQLKIGLNTGEPIAEDGDLFGSTVQLSARITDKAKANEIFVPDSVRIVCAGKNYRFVSRGGYAMKGFEDDITLYEVVWDEEVFSRKQAGAAAAASPAAAARPAAPARPAAAPR
ncbi:MAG: adenylate/guanylate cyclase domain-containing protein [Rhodospirillales bacterium]|nr:adenylate/guanylate cyclase domain-containing protein [Rhodospirillales bacterium]